MNQIYSQYVLIDNFPRYLDILLLSLIWKVRQFISTLNKLEEYSIFTKRQKNIIALFKLIFTIIIIAHLLSCLWIGVAEIGSYNGRKTWLKNNTISTINWYTLYIDAYYFTTVTMITVGFGDIIPISEEEKTVCIIFMIFSCGVFAYSMNTIGSILQSFNEDQVILQQNMSIINSYMKRKNVSKMTQNAIREYLEYYWKEENERNQEQEEKILSILSENLRDNLLIEGKGVVLKQSAIFRDNFSDEVKQKIVPLIKEYRFTPEEIICTQGEVDDCSIYFIEKGSVNILVENESLQYYPQSSGMKQISTLTAGQSFGEIGFFTGKTRTATVKSKEFTTILLIKRQDFLQMVVNLEEDYEQFCNIKDNILIYQDFQLIDVKCLSCKSLKHQIMQCPFLHFIPNHAKLREQYICNSSQDRIKMIRKIKDKKKSLNILKEVFVMANRFQEYDSEMQEYIKAFIEHDSNEIFRSDYDDQSEGPSIQLRPNNEGGLFEKPNQLYSQGNLMEEIQKKDSSLQQSMNTSFHRQTIIFAEVEKKQIHTDVSPTVIPSIIDVQDQNFNAHKTIYTNQQQNKAKTKPHSYINREEEGESYNVMQKPKLPSSEKILSSLGENRKSFNDNYVNSNAKLNYEEKYLNDLFEKPVQTQSYIPQLPSQLAYSKQRSSIQQQQRNQETQNIGLQKYQQFYNKILGVLLESMQQVQKEQNQQQSESPSIKKHMQNPYTNNLTPDQLQRVLNHRQVDKKSSFLVRANYMNSSFNNQVVVSSKNLLSKQISQQKGERKIQKGVEQAQTMTKETINMLDQTNNAQYMASQNDLEKYSYEDFVFDIMKNFTYYFPLNNFNHQIMLMRLNSEQKRQKMLRNHIENLNFIKKNKSFIQSRKHKRKSSINSQIHKTLIKPLNDEDILDSYYTKKRSKFYQSQTNQLERSSILIAESSKRFDKLDSFSQAHVKKQIQIGNSMNLNNLDLNKSAQQKQLYETFNFEKEDSDNSINYFSNTLVNKSTRLKKNQLQCFEDELKQQSLKKKFESKENHVRECNSQNSINNSMNPYYADNSIQKIMNMNNEESKIQSDITKSQIENQYYHPLVIESLKKVGSRIDDQSVKSKKVIGDQEYDIQTDFSQKKNTINTINPKIASKYKQKF